MVMFFVGTHVPGGGDFFDNFFFRGHGDSNARGTANKKRKNYDLVVRIDCAYVFVYAAAEEASGGAGT